MNREKQIQLFLDGELSEQAHRTFVEAMESDEMLASEVASLAESMEWHKACAPEPKAMVFVENELSVIQNMIRNDQSSQSSKILRFPGKWMAYTTGVAAAILVAFSVFIFSGSDAGKEKHSFSNVAFVDTDIDGASSTVFTDEDSGWTFVWVDEPELG